MTVHIFVLLLCVVHVGEAVRLKKAILMLREASSGQKSGQTRETEETIKFEDVVSEEIQSARAEAVRIKNATGMLPNTSSRRQAGKTRDVEETAASEYIINGVSNVNNVSKEIHVARTNIVISILFIAIIFLIVVICSLAAVAFGGLLPPPKNCARRSRRPRNALAANVETGTDKSNLEWCHPDRISIRGTLTADIEIITPNWNSESLREVLHTYGVHRWTQKQLEHFAKELSTGKARLAKEGKSLVRVVDMLILLVVYERDELVLQEIRHPAFHGMADDEAYVLESTLKSQFRSNDSFMECANRCLQKLGGGLGKLIEIVPDILGMREERRILRSAHPDLPTLIQYYVVEARVAATDPHDLENLGLLSRTLHVAEYIYRWEDLDSVPLVNRHLRKSWGTSGQGSAMWSDLNHFLVPVLPWTEIAVLEKLKERCLPSCSVPPLDAMRSLLRALNEGHVTLAVRSGNPPRLVCVKEKVSVVVKSGRSAMILLSGFSEDGSPILPSVERHTSESPWRAAIRISQTVLGLSVPLFQMDGRVLGVSDAAEEQNLWELVTREYILRGPLIDCCVKCN